MFESTTDNLATPPRVARAWKGGIDLSMLADHLRSVVADLRRVFRLPVGWDTNDSPPVTSEARKSAIALLDCMGGSSLYEPTVVPVPGGGIQFEFEVGDRELELEVLPSGGLVYLQVLDDEPGDAGDISPNEVTRLLRWVAAS